MQQRARAREGMRGPAYTAPTQQHICMHICVAEAFTCPSPPCCPALPCRILFKLDELVRPYVHKILVVIEPLLIDEDYYARVEVRAGAVRAPCHAGIHPHAAGDACALWWSAVELCIRAACVRADGSQQHVYSPA